MILFRDNMIGVNQYNVIVLEVESGGFIYISKDVYDQMVVLSDRYSGDLESVVGRVLNKTDSQEKAVDYFYENAPEPANILAPFLGLVSEEYQLELNIRYLCGVLHQIATVINFEHVTFVPKEVRAKLSLSSRFIRGFESGWAEIGMQLTPSAWNMDELKARVVDELIGRVTGGVAQVSGAIYASNASNVSVNSGEGDDEEDVFAAAARAMEEEFARQEREEERTGREHNRVEVSYIKKEEPAEAKSDEADIISSIIGKFSGGGR